MNHVLTAAHTDQILCNDRGEQSRDRRRCFCESSAVYTDDVTVSSKQAIIEMARYYRFAGYDLNELLREFLEEAV